MDKITRDVQVQRYYPDVLAPAKEFRALAEAVNPEFKALYDALWRWFANTFVFQTDELGVKRWEDMLKLYPEAGATLDDRRLAIFMRINYGLPYTEKSFQTMLDAMFGKGQVVSVVSPGTYTVAFDLKPDMLGKQTAVKRYARLILPANLLFITTSTQTINGNTYVGSYMAAYRKKTIIKGW